MQICNINILLYGTQAIVNVLTNCAIKMEKQEQKPFILVSTMQIKYKQLVNFISCLEVVQMLICRMHPGVFNCAPQNQTNGYPRIAHVPGKAHRQALGSTKQQ